jgi:hypothetical protein
VPVLVADSSWHRLRPARLAGLPVFFGEPLSEEAETSLELGAIGSLLAATSNDAYNALVCAHFAPELGRQRVFQLAAEEVPERRRPGPGARGQTAFSEEVKFEQLERGWYEGWTFQRTKITEDLDLDAFLAGLPEDALPLLVIRDKGGVRFLEADARPKPAPGDRLVWFGKKGSKPVQTPLEEPPTEERHLV